MNRIVKLSSLSYIILGLLVALGPQLLFKACPTTEKLMKCHWSTQALLIIGGLILLVGILKIIFSVRNFTLDIVAVALGLSAISIPTWVIGGCSNLEMACRTITFPMIYLISGFIILISGFTIFCVRKERV